MSTRPSRRSPSHWARRCGSSPPMPASTTSGRPITDFHRRRAPARRRRTRATASWSRGTWSGGGHRIMLVNDPARGRYEVDLDAGRGNPAQVSLWLMPDSPNARKQEPSVIADSDGDKVVDFDETERFRTDPRKTGHRRRQGRRQAGHRRWRLRADLRIRTQAWRREPGTRLRRRPLADGARPRLGPRRLPGRRRGHRTATGHRAGKETWNFDAADDVCGDLSGNDHLDPPRHRHLAGHAIEQQRRGDPRTCDSTSRMGSGSTQGRPLVERSSRRRAAETGTLLRHRGPDAVGRMPQDGGSV